MALQEGLIRTFVVPDDFAFINGRVITIYPQSFEISTNGGSTYNEMDSFGTVQSLVNCTNAGSTVGYLKLLVFPEVTSFSFQLSNDTAVPKTTFTFNTKNCISLPDISIFRVKSVIGSSANDVTGLLTSTNLNPASPRIPKSEIYLPATVSINNLPDLVGNSDLSSPHSLGELAGYCHTAAAGFLSNWTGGFVQYNSSVEIYLDTTKQQIPIAGDLNTYKWNDIKLIYPDNQIFSGLNYNHIFSHNCKIRFNNVNENEADFVSPRSLAIYYNNGSDYVLMQTVTKNVTFEGRHFTITFTITGSSVLQKRVNWSLSITNNRSVDLVFANGLKTHISFSTSSLSTVDTSVTDITIMPGQTKSWTGVCYYHAGDYSPELVAGDEITIDLLRWAQYLDNATQTYQWDWLVWQTEFTNIGA